MSLTLPGDNIKDDLRTKGRNPLFIKSMSLTEGTKTTPDRAANLVAILYSSSLCLSPTAEMYEANAALQSSQSFIHQVYVSHIKDQLVDAALTLPSQSFIHQVYVSHEGQSSRANRPDHRSQSFIHQVYVSHGNDSGG